MRTSLTVAGALASVLLCAWLIPAAGAAENASGALPAEAHAVEGDAHGADAQGHGESSEAPPELPNLFLLIQAILGPDSDVSHFLHKHFHNGWDNTFFAFLIVIVAYFVTRGAMGGRLRNPGRGQGALEAVVEGIYDFLSDVMGRKNAREFLPLIGSLFLFIFIANFIGVVPLGKSPTSTWKVTFALSIPVFFIVQYVGLRRCGLKGRLYHLMGSPKDIFGWMLAPLMLVIELIGEIAKPMSLGLRLFGNILGEDTLLGVMAMLGVMMIAGLGLKLTFVGLPLQFPFIFLALLVSFIQALVFSLLSSIYILLALPHHESDGEKESH